MDTYQADGTPDPELYERVMTERYGPLPALIAEGTRPALAAPARPKPRRHSRRWPDPQANEHRDELLRALASRPTPPKAT